MITAPTALQSYKNLKAKHPDALLLFRNGHFYDILKEDATKAEATLGISRYEMEDEREGIFFLAYFPAAKLDEYLPKLIRAGHRVAICDFMTEQPWQQAAQAEERRAPSYDLFANDW